MNVKGSEKLVNNTVGSGRLGMSGYLPSRLIPVRGAKNGNSDGLADEHH